MADALDSIEKWTEGAIVKAAVAVKVPKDVAEAIAKVIMTFISHIITREVKNEKKKGNVKRDNSHHYCKYFIAFYTDWSCLFFSFF
ncbi:hypothetical protein [Paenibacillus sp. OSY-SE]|uniref:hypothetical protein n=1 Tax=Paenibacillus sp. OSY-SE TaxID=1196323 RepID=UPI00178C3074|nr:hypothetical protein [Paenibacillus sp. OSY-SE]